MESMKKILLICAMLLVNWMAAQAKSDSVSVTLQNAHRTITYKGALLVDGKTLTLKNQTLEATEGNEIAVLVVNGGKLVLDHCTIDSYATILERQRKEQKEQREKKNGRSGIRIRENLGQIAKRERSPSSAVKDIVSLTLQTY